MKYYTDFFKIIHFDGLDKVNSVDEFERVLTLVPEPFEPFNGQLPIIFLWKYRVYKNGSLVLSYVGQDKYRLEFNKHNLTPLTELWKLIDHSHMVLCNEWRGLIMDSEIKNWNIVPLSPEEIIETCKEIIMLAQSLQLFR